MIFQKQWCFPFARSILVNLPERSSDFEKMDFRTKRQQSMKKQHLNDYETETSEMLKPEEQTHSIGKKICHILPVLFLPLVFLYFELVLRLFDSTNPLSNFLYPFLFSIAIGLLFSGITAMLPPKVNKICNMVILYLGGLLFTVECMVKNSFQVYMELGSILAGTDGVVNGYSDSLMSSIFNGIPKILLFFAPAVGYTIFGRKILLVPQKSGKLFHALRPLHVQLLCLSLVLQLQLLAAIRENIKHSFTLTPQQKHLDC